MAVDLTPRFRRLNSQTRSFRDNIQHDFSGPFGATQLWHNIIHALQSQVEVQRCRRHLRVHAECFTGSDAVDTVLSYLMQNVMFCTSDLSRLKAARLCQALMEAKVFEPVGTKLFRREKEVTFEDSSYNLYHFLEYKGVSSSTVKEGSVDIENIEPEEHGAKRKKMSRFDELLTISNPLAVKPSERMVERLLRTINLQPCLSSALKKPTTNSGFLSKSVVDEVWKQQTLLQLLQMVELPVLECILTSPERVQPQRCRVPVHGDLVISNTCLDRELPDTLNLPQMDEWLSAAADCLELFPDQLIMVAGEKLSKQDGAASMEAANLEQMISHKRLLFDTIAKYYSGQDKAPLLSGRYLDIHAAILNLLDEGKRQDAIRASQLCLRLLDTSSRDELRRLLAFMATAAQPDACQLQKKTDNRILVCRTFQRALIQNHELTRSRTVFGPPFSLNFQKQKPFFMFLLKQLLQEISSSKSMKVKEKRKLLKEFEKHHPVVFLQHFSSIF
uniref:DEP domain-containing protein n=1 Tax=Oryzias latipes TaxID=8090 RepID=A0A3B3H6S3_ORYLA